MRFTDQDYERIKKRLGRDHTRARTRLNARHSNNRCGGAILRKRRRCSRAPNLCPHQGHPDETIARQPSAMTESVDLKRLQSDNLNLHIDLLRHNLDDIEQEQRIWELRFAAVRQRLAPSEEREAQKKLVSTLQQIEGAVGIRLSATRHDGSRDQ